MCGIAGILLLTQSEPVAQRELRSMLGMIAHRGPDQFGIYRDRHVGLGNARLSIIDVASGQQPISNADGSVWIVFNGEIFNYLELRPELEARGHTFATKSDTEVLLHAYEEYGPKCLDKLNGQFAFAIWDSRDQTLVLARDRLGVRPLFYTEHGGRLIFASEIKAILANRQVRAEIDPAALEQIFTFWSPLSPRTAFRHILELPPGHYLVARKGDVRVKSYWQLTFPDLAETSMRRLPEPTTEEYLEKLGSLLTDAAKIRLRADVPVGAYLSGGLDSSIIAAIIRRLGTSRLTTFSIAFSDADYDESRHQEQMARFLDTRHEVACVSHADIGRVFPDVVWHTEVPLTRTAPAPMFMLSRLVRAHGFKVVLTGEGADEFLAGYDVFREMKVRRFWARQPGSRLRPMLLRRLYADVPGFAGDTGAFLEAFFKQQLTELDSPTYSHAIRWRNSGRGCRFFSEAVRRNAGPPAGAAVEALLPHQFRGWAPLARAQYLEIKLFLSQYLLSSQGDRMAMAHSVEGRFPFLDHRLTDFCTQLPETLKMRGLTEKYLLRRLGERWLPSDIWRRRKRPYRAPIHRSFFAEPRQDYVRDVLSPGELKAAGLFDPAAVGQLLQRIEAGKPLGETDDMALVGIISTQLLHRQFVAGFEVRPPLPDQAPIKVCLGPERKQDAHPDREVFMSKASSTGVTA